MSTSTKLALVVVLMAAALVAGVLLGRRPAAPTIAPGPVGNTTVVTVPKPALDSKTVQKYVTDKPEVARLVTDMKAAKVTPTLVAETTATLPPAPADTPRQVEAVTVVGTLAGKPTAATRLFEVGPGGARTELPDAKTTVVTASPSAPSWRLGLAVQAGVVAIPKAGTFEPEAGIVVGAAWLRRGSSSAAEDCSLAILTPAVVVTGTTREVAILPASVNIARLVPHQPLRDLWLAPVVTRHSIGVGVLVTF